MDELEALKYLKSNFDQKKQDIILGIGDDSAVIRFDSDKLVVTSTDSLIENQHFLMDKITPREIGYKAVAVSVSDIGAMGGEPRFILSTIGFKNELGEGFFKDIIDGIIRASAEFNVDLIGGQNISNGYIIPAQQYPPNIPPQELNFAKNNNRIVYSVSKQPCFACGCTCKSRLGY